VVSAVARQHAASTWLEAVLLQQQKQQHIVRILLTIVIDCQNLRTAKYSCWRQICLRQRTAYR
jgi:hypothetical protein